MEQIEYQKEDIEWSFIEFPDNQDCLDLIESRQRGLFSMLDDECRLPGMLVYYCVTLLLLVYHIVSYNSYYY